MYSCFDFHIKILFKNPRLFYFNRFFKSNFFCWQYLRMLDYTFPHRDAFWHIISRRRLKTLQQQKKLLSMLQQCFQVRLSSLCFPQIDFAEMLLKSPAAYLLYVGKGLTFCAISPFVTMFSKSHLLQRHPKAFIWGKGLKCIIITAKTLPKPDLLS